MPPRCRGPANAGPSKSSSPPRPSAALLAIMRELLDRTGRLRVPGRAGTGGRPAAPARPRPVPLRHAAALGTVLRSRAQLGSAGRAGRRSAGCPPGRPAGPAGERGAEPPRKRPGRPGRAHDDAARSPPAPGGRPREPPARRPSASPPPWCSPRRSTVAGVIAFGAAWLRGWPPARLVRAAAFCAADGRGLARRDRAAGARRAAGPARAVSRLARAVARAHPARLPAGRGADCACGRAARPARGRAWPGRCAPARWRRWRAVPRPPRPSASTVGSGGIRRGRRRRASPRRAPCRCSPRAAMWPSAPSSARCSIRPDRWRRCRRPGCGRIRSWWARPARARHAAAAAVGGVHGHRPAAARGRPGRAAAAGGAGLQGRRRCPADRGPGPAGAARRGRPQRGGVARRGRAQPLDAATAPARQHTRRPRRARHRRRGVLHRRHGRHRRAGRRSALRAAGQQHGLPRPAGPRLARVRLLGRRASTTSCSSPGPRPGRYPTWRCGSAPCSGGSAPAWTGRADFGAADAWYCILEGTGELAVAEAQARALVDLLASHVTRSPGTAASRPDPSRRGRIQRGRAQAADLAAVRAARSLGLAVQVSAQSWHGLAPEEVTGTGSRRPPKAASGCCALPHPEPVAALAGQRKSADTTRLSARLPRAGGRQGSTRVRDVPVVDPALIRALDVGQAAYIYRGGVSLYAGQAARRRSCRAGAARSGPARGAAGGPIRAAGRAARQPAAGPASRCQRLPGRGIRPGPAPLPGPGRHDPPALATRSAHWACSHGAELGDDDIRAAWRRVAAATHPDRPRRR